LSGQRIGYIRVSSADQNPDRQIEAIGPVYRIFVDHISGKSKNRPALAECLNYARTGDILIIHSMDRLARNLDDLRSIVKSLTDQQIRVEFIKEGLTFTGEDSPMSTLLLSVMGAFAEFERSLIRERQREGIELAKKKGKYKGRKPVLSQEQIEQVREMDSRGISKAEIAKEFKVSRQTIYAALP
jgi:DNA invertase Pin-like site-specific DNA recombinase